MWSDAYAWVTFLAAPLAMILIVVYVFRPSARRKHQEAKQIPFDDDGRPTRGHR